MNPAERVRRLMESGAIARDEGERLLAALPEPGARSFFSTMIHPFDRFGGGIAAIVGLLVSVLSLGATRLGIRFDGFLDLHIGHSAIPALKVSVSEQCAAWILPSLLFFAYSRIWTRHVRVLDFLGMVGLARLPIMAVSWPIAILGSHVSEGAKITPALLGLTFFALVGVGFYITLLYQGFKNASGLSGAKLVAGFIAMIVVAEVVSKLALFLI